MTIKTKTITLEDKGYTILQKIEYQLFSLYAEWVEAYVIGYNKFIDEVVVYIPEHDFYTGSPDTNRYRS